MSDDEPIDGPRVAAQILKHLPSADQERLVEALRESNPEIARQVRDNLFTYEDIASLSTQGIQVLLRQVEHSDLVISLKRTSEKLKQLFFENMSERKRHIVEEDFAALPAAPLSDIEAAQHRIVAKVEELRTTGSIRSESAKDVWV